MYSQGLRSLSEEVLEQCTRAAISTNLIETIKEEVAKDAVDHSATILEDTIVKEGTTLACHEYQSQVASGHLLEDFVAQYIGRLASHLQDEHGLAE